MPFDDWLTYLTITAISFGLLVIANLALRKQHPQVLYTIWYTFSLSLVIFTAAELTARIKGTTLVHLCGAQEEMCRTIYSSLTNPIDEAILLLAVIILVYIPQILAYYLAGIFGAGTAPKFVDSLESFVLWSYVKFCAVLSGALIASTISTATVHDITLLFSQVASLSAAFSIAVFRCTSFAFTEEQRDLFRQLSWLHRLLTRNSKPQIMRADVISRLYGLSHSDKDRDSDKSL